MAERLDPGLRKNLEDIARTIRGLSIDTIEKAGSGHPGLPLGCAEIGAMLYGKILRHNPADPRWINRDRFILSAGHGSAWLYSCLHLSGFDLSLEDLAGFRQLDSKTPGHPEAGETPGVETTTGPLGQGVANAVGTALGLKMLASRFKNGNKSIIDGKVYCLMGDGCMMEGISSEASSFAGHLGLDNLVLIYDSNGISLDGPLHESCSEDTIARYRSYGWKVIEADGNDPDSLFSAFGKAANPEGKPVLIVATTIIGKGSPGKAGSYKAHGAPLGEAEARATKEALGIPPEPFFVPGSVRQYFDERLEAQASSQDGWRKMLDGWAEEFPGRYEEFKAMSERIIPGSLEENLKAIGINSPISGRKASSAAIQVLAGEIPFVVGGSADLSSSDSTMISDYPVIAPGRFEGRNIKFGVREFAMAAMASGLSQTGMFLPFIGTFLTFSDYMRNAIRLAALMKQRVIYHFTHDSIFLGEDGPTHQPVEHLAALRAIPGLQVIRPCDANEVRGAWIAALGYDGPTALVLSRQDLPTLPGTAVPFADGVGRGAYIIDEAGSGPDFTIVASGSEVSLALEVAAELKKRGRPSRVVSMPSREIFESQDVEYRISIFSGDIGRRVSIEAGIEDGWHKYIGLDGIAISIDDFGRSAPASALAGEFGFTADSIIARILE